MQYLIGIQRELPLIKGVDGGLLPSMLLATTYTKTVVLGGHEEEVNISKLWVHTPPTQAEAGIMAIPQMLPNVISM